MKCSVCGKAAVYKNPDLCKDHLISHVEESVAATILEHGLCTPKERICVAASGGKDSVTLLHILNKLGYRVQALAVDEGIEGYRKKTLVFLEGFCQERNIPLNIITFEEEFGHNLDIVVKGKHPCSICGVYRRYLLNKHSQGFDVIATGHNLDDEAQVVLMNLIKANQGLYRTHIKTPPSKGFTIKIKPLMFTPEKMVRAYTLVNNFEMGFDECPYVQQSLRAKVRDALNKYESTNPGMKRRLVQAALHVASRQATAQDTCAECGQPSSGKLCRACLLKKELR